MSIYIMALAVGVQFAGCPAVIEDKQSVEPVAGWSVSVGSAPRRLQAVALYSGDPSKRREVMPVPGQKKGVKTWGFGQEEVWVECEYADSAAVLKKNLGRVKSCDFTPRQGGTSDPAKLSCER